MDFKSKIQIEGGSCMKNERGSALIIAIIVILVIIAAELFFSAWSSNKVLQAKKCQMAIIRMQAFEQQHQAAKASQSSDAPALCEQINTLVDNYNNSDCGKDFGTLPRLACN